MTSYIYIGCSHTRAIRLALASRGSVKCADEVHVIHMRDSKFLPEAYGACSSRPLGNAVADYAEVHLPADGSGVVVSCMNGNYHNVLGLMTHPTPFDFVLSENSDLPLDTKARIIPGRILQEFMWSEIKKETESISGICAINAKLFHVESPPPVRSESHILKYADDFFKRRGIDKRGVSPPWLRYKLWRLYSTLIRQECDRLGIVYVPTPPDVCDEDGFLDKRGYYSDATHANGWYGSSIMASVGSLQE